VLTDPAFWAAAAPAVIILGLAKGGFAGIGVLAVPLMALVISPVEAASIVLPILLVQDVVSVFAFRRAVAWPIVRLMLPGAAVGIFLGYALAAFVSAAAVELAVGLTAIAFGAHRLWSQRVARAAAAVEAAEENGAPWLGLACAVASGFTSQVAHAGGPPFQIYVLPKRLPRDVFIGTSAVFFAAVNWLKVPAYLGLGQITPTVMATAAALLPLAVVSTWAGVWLVRRVPAERFYTVIYLLLVGVGLKLVADGVAGL
jgi:hypothetical protein